MGVQCEGSHLRMRHDAAYRVPSRVQFRFDAQPRRRSRVANKRDHRLEGMERTTAPILGDVTEEAMLDLVPLAGARREMRDVNPEAHVVGQPLQLLLPRARAIAVA